MSNRKGILIERFQSQKAVFSPSLVLNRDLDLQRRPKRVYCVDHADAQYLLKPSI